MDKKIIIAIIVLGIFFIFNAALAQVTFTPQVPFGSITGEIQIGPDTVGQYVKAVIAFVSAIVIVAAIIMIMVAGVQWITAAGDSGKIGKAKDTIIKAVTGLVIALFAVFILQLINPATTIFKPLTPEEIQPIQKEACTSSCPEGSDCTSDTQCSSNYCSPSLKKCTTLAGGTNCTNTNQCLLGLYCKKIAGNPNQCSAKNPIGSDCSIVDAVSGNANEMCQTNNCDATTKKCASSL